MSQSNLPSTPTWVRVATPIISRLPIGRYRAIKHLCYRPGRPFLTRMPKALGGYAFECDLRDGISREVCFTGRYEPQETLLVQSILRQGMSFVDVGANWGYFTLLAASSVGRNGRVLSLEPDPRLFTALTENIERSELKQVTALQVAAARELGTLMLAGYQERDENFGVSRIVSKSNGYAHLFNVNADSLDHLLQQFRIDSVDLLKMDIEGAEVLALDGLAKSISEKRVKRLLLELHPSLIEQHGISAAAIMGHLLDSGYRALTIDHSPAATRRASYARESRIDTFLRPLDLSAQLDAWPHQLWLAPDME